MLLSPCFKNSVKLYGITCGLNQMEHEKVSMTRKCHNHTLQTNIQQSKEDTEH